MTEGSTYFSAPPIGKATVVVVIYDSATISCRLYGDIKSYVIIYLRKQRAT